MYYSVDRIEENVAVLEDDNEKKINVDVSSLPQGTSECDVLVKDKNGLFVKDDEEKKRRQDLILKMLEDF